MLTLIEAETTNKLKSSQTSFKKTTPILCIYTSKVRSLQLHRVDLPNFFFTQLVGNRLFRCSTAKCYSKKFEERKRSCFHVPFEDKLLNAGQMFEQRTMQLTTEKAYQPQWVSVIKLSVVDWTSNFLTQRLFPTIFQIEQNARHDRSTRFVDIEAVRINQVWNYGDARALGMRIIFLGREGRRAEMKLCSHAFIAVHFICKRGPLVLCGKLERYVFSFIYDCPLHVSLTTILAAVSPSHVNGQSARSGGWQTSSREQPRRLPKRRWHGRKRSCRTERSCRERD